MKYLYKTTIVIGDKNIQDFEQKYKLIAREIDELIIGETTAVINENYDTFRLGINGIAITWAMVHYQVVYKKYILYLIVDKPI